MRKLIAQLRSAVGALFERYDGEPRFTGRSQGQHGMSGEARRDAVDAATDREPPARPITVATQGGA